jgi:hypothetical protein
MKLYDKYGEDYIYSGTMGSVSGQLKTLDEGYNLYERDFTPQEYFETMLSQFGKYITTGAWLVPGKLVNSTHGWDSKAGLNDDGEYFMRIILNSAGIIYCKESIFYFRRDVPNSLSKQFNNKEVYVKWLYSYCSYADNFMKEFEDKIAKELSWKALSVYYCNSYPLYPDLLAKCIVRIKEVGYEQPNSHGGTLFQKISSILGVIISLKLWHFKSKIQKWL